MARLEHKFDEQTYVNLQSAIRLIYADDYDYREEYNRTYVRKEILEIS